MPDIIHIFLNGSVGCELAAACNVEDCALCPALLIAVCLFYLLLCICIRTEVLQNEVGICLRGALGVKQGVIQGTEPVRIVR